MVELQDKAREILKGGKIDEALLRYEQLYQLDPDNTTALFYMAHIHDQCKGLARASEVLLEIAKYHPDGEVYCKLAQNALERRQYDESIGYARQAQKHATETDGWIEEARTIMADSTYKLGDIKTALEIYEQVLAVDQNHVRAITGRGTVALTSKDYRMAIDFFDRALNANPHHGRAILGKGLAYIGLDRRREAASLISEALMINPDNSWAIAIVLPILSESGKLEDANRLLKSYLNLYPDDYPMLLARAGVAFALGRYDLSRELLGKVKATHPEYPGTEDLEKELQNATIAIDARIEVPEAVPA